MDNSLVNIRFRYWHLKLYSSKPWVKIETSQYWHHYYTFKGEKPKEPLFAVYKFFL